MKTRYTGKSLEADCVRFNAQLAERGDSYRFDVGYRNGYTAVDLATPAQLERHCCQRNLEVGTPRDCLNACYRYLSEPVHIRPVEFIAIPQVGRVPAYSLDPRNVAQVRNLVKRADAYFRLSAKAWEARNTAGLAPARYRYLEKRETALAANGEALLAPLGIKCDWPGLYPSFKVRGYDEHATSSAVLAALQLPRNFLVEEGK